MRGDDGAIFLSRLSAVVIFLPTDFAVQPILKGSRQFNKENIDVRLYEDNQEESKCLENPC